LIVMDFAGCFINCLRISACLKVRFPDSVMIFRA
jgi:hypothetical protein